MIKILQFWFVLILVFSNILDINAQNSNTSAYRVVLLNDTVKCNTTTDKKLLIIADSTAIFKDAIIKIAFPKIYGDYAFDDMLWIIIPPYERAGYLKAKSATSNKKAKITNVQLAIDEFTNIPSSAFGYNFSHENNQRIVSLQMLDTLPKGDTLVIHYGANGASTYTYNSAVEQKDKFTVFIKNNTTNYAVINSKPSIYIKHGNAQKLRLVISSLAQKNENCLLKIMVNDITNNLVNDFVGNIQLSCSDANAIFPSTIDITAADKGHKDVIIKFTDDGIYKINANVISSNMPISGIFTSNPISISTDSLHIFFGEFHTHTQFSRDGFGSDGYAYARNAIGLDFYCGTDHSDMNQVDTFGINTIEWNDLIVQSQSVHQNGRFVSFLGYENSLDNPSGHYNFIYNYTDSNATKIPVLARHFQFNIQNFWTKLDQLNLPVEVLTIPHHTGKIFSVTAPNAECSRFGGTFKNDKYKRLIEIYSIHGLCESYNPNHNLAYEKFNAKSTTFPCYAQDAWAAREYLGVIASTDSHSSQAAAVNIGVCAIYADTLMRENLFRSAYNRHTYATTGEKIILKFSINNHILGDTFTLACNTLPIIKTEVIGTDFIDYIELLKFDLKNGTYSGAQPHPNFQVLEKATPNTLTQNYSFNYVDADYKDSSLYYIRVKQKNTVNNREVWAWSSPIWVFPKTCSTTNLKTDSIFNFNHQNIENNIAIKWNIDKELKTEKYIIQASADSINFEDIGLQNASLIPLLDTMYSFTDSVFIGNPVYYRIKQIFYNDSINYSNTIKIIFPFFNDTILEFDVNITNNGILNNWKSKEFRTQRYAVQRSETGLNFQTIKNQISAQSPDYNYSFNDSFPLEDLSFYRIVQILPVGNYKLSETKSIYFPYDTILQINSVVENEKIKLCWQITNQTDLLNYTIQRSADSLIFSDIDTLAFTGSLFDTINYCMYDTSPFSGKNYYRIVVNRIGKAKEFSSIQSVNYIITGLHNNNSNSLSLKLVNNLIAEGSNQLFIQTSTNKNISGKLYLFDILGNTYFNQTVEINPSKNYFYLPIANLQHGRYFVVFNYNNEIIKLDFMVVDGD